MAVGRFKAFGRGTTAPVAVCLSALFGQIGNLADGLIHKLSLSYFTKDQADLMESLFRFLP
jgi:hypothetical protein